MARRWKALALTLVVLVVVALGTAVAMPALTQEPFGTLVQAVRLAVTPSTLAQLETEPGTWIVQGSDFEELRETLAVRGWTSVERFGAAYHLEHSSAADESTTLTCRMYSTAFQICELSPDHT